MSLLVRRVLGGFSWIDDVLLEVTSNRASALRELSWWFSRVFVCAPYALPLIFYWNAVRGRYLMFVTCTASMLSSVIKNMLDSAVVLGTSQKAPCYQRTSISVPAVTTVCFLHVLLDFEPLWFDATRRNVCTIFFAFVSFLLDCPFGNCMIISFALSHLLAVTAIRFRHALVIWYEGHLPKIWFIVAATMVCVLILGFRPCHLKENDQHPFHGGISSVVRPLGSILGLIVCDKLDESAYIRSHICGKGLCLSSWLVNLAIGVCFTFVDLQLTFQSYVFSSLAIPSLLVVHTIVSCRVVPLLDLKRVEKRNSRFIELLAAAINSCRKPRQRNTVNIGQVKRSSPYTDAVQKPLSKTPGNLVNRTGMRDPEVADLMKVTSTSRTEDALNPTVTTKRILKPDTSGAKMANFATVHGILRCDPAAVSLKVTNKDAKVVFPLALPLRPGSSPSDTHAGVEVRSSSPTPASR